MYEFPEIMEIFFNFRPFSMKIGNSENIKKFNNSFVNRPRTLKFGQNQALVWSLKRSVGIFAILSFFGFLGILRSKLWIFADFGPKFGHKMRFFPKIGKITQIPTDRF